MKIMINKIIQKLGRGGYQIDKRLGPYNLFIILFEKFIQALRGSFYKIILKKSMGIIFVGKNCKLKHCNLIEVGKTLFIGDYVEINAVSALGVKIGDNVSIHRNTIIDCTGGIRSLGEGLEIGNNVGFSPNCFIQVRGNVKIGNNVIFGPYVKIFSETHNFSNQDKYINEQGETRKGVIIEDGVWVGAAAIILDGVTVGSNSIVAAGSVVTKNVPPFTIVAGMPAEVIKNRR